MDDLKEIIVSDILVTVEENYFTKWDIICLNGSAYIIKSHPTKTEDNKYSFYVTPYTKQQNIKAILITTPEIIKTFKDIP